MVVWWCKVRTVRWMVGKLQGNIHCCWCPLDYLRTACTISLHAQIWSSLHCCIRRWILLGETHSANKNWTTLWTTLLDQVQCHCSCASTFPMNTMWPTLVPSVACYHQHKCCLYQKIKWLIRRKLQAREPYLLNVPYSKNLNLKREPNSGRIL